MDIKRVHIISRGEGWVIKKQENIRATKWFDSKDEAIENAQVFRKKGYDLIVHRTDGGVEAWKKPISTIRNRKITTAKNRNIRSNA